MSGTAPEGRHVHALHRDSAGRIIAVLIGKSRRRPIDWRATGEGHTSQPTPGVLGAVHGINRGVIGVGPAVGSDVGDRLQAAIGIVSVLRLLVLGIGAREHLVGSVVGVDDRCVRLGIDAGLRVRHADQIRAVILKTPVLSAFGADQGYAGKMVESIVGVRGHEVRIPSDGQTECLGGCGSGGLHLRGKGERSTCRRGANEQPAEVQRDAGRQRACRERPAISRCRSSARGVQLLLPRGVRGRTGARPGGLVGAGRFERPTPCAQGSEHHLYRELLNRTQWLSFLELPAVHPTLSDTEEYAKIRGRFRDRVYMGVYAITDGRKIDLMAFNQLADLLLPRERTCIDCGAAFLTASRVALRCEACRPAAVRRSIQRSKARKRERCIRPPDAVVSE
jgi:hypothetical protein